MTGLAELYLVSAGIGSAYLIISFLMGQVGNQGSGDGGSDAGGADTSGADVSGADLSGADASGADISGADASGVDAMLTSATSHLSANTLAGRSLPLVSAKRTRLLFTIMSPMTISTFLSFFGISGIILTQTASFLGFCTIIPALLIGFLITRIILGAMSALSKKMYVTSVVSSR